MKARDRDGPTVPVGFDYAAAIFHIREHRTYDQIAEYVGYESRNAVRRVLCGCRPAHPQGEALYALYKEIFNRDPPMTPQQKAGRFGKVT